MLTMKILVLNVNRMGDQLQALPFYWALKRSHPDARLSVFVDRVSDKDQVVRWLTPPVDEFIPLDLDRLKPSEGFEPPIIEGQRYLRELAAEMRSREIDLLINLSHGRFSALLMNFFSTPKTRVLGHVLSRNRQRLFRGDWLTYLFTMVATRRLNRFHLVDLYIRGCGLPPLDGLPGIPIGEEDRQWLHEFLTKQGVGPNEPLIAVQPGASEYRKRWEADQFARSIRLMKERNGLRAIVLGSEKERPLWDAMRPLLPDGTLDGFGTTLDQAKAVLGRASLLITNDTGPMHVAATLGTPCVIISVGSVYYPETFGYSPDNIILQANLPCAPCTENVTCNNTLCHAQITPEDVVTAAESLLKLQPDRSPLFNGQCTFYRSRTDRDGMLMCEPMRPLAPSREGLIALAYREIWKTALDFKNVDLAWADLKNSIDVWYGWDTLTEQLFRSDLQDIESLAGNCRDAQTTARELEVALFQGDAGRTTAKSCIEKLARGDQTVVDLGYRNPMLQPLLRQYRFERERLNDGTALDWAQLSQVHLGSLERRAQILGLFLERIASGGN